MPISLIKTIRKQLLNLKNRKHIDSQIWQMFWQRLDSKAGLLKGENTSDHYCCFFLPFYRPDRSVYLGHHIKADDWIAPGGHIDEGEYPIDTVKREFWEELQHQLTDEPITLFDLTIKYMDNPRHNCKVHYDLWYLVEVKEKKNYIYLRREYHDAGWFSLATAVKKITKNPDYARTVGKIIEIFM